MTDAYRAAGLVLGFVADRCWGDPRRWHPVAGFGRTAAVWEEVGYADSRRRGTLYTVSLVGSAALVGRWGQWYASSRAGSGRVAARVVGTAVVTWVVLGGRSLEREALAVHGLLTAGDLPGARRRLTHLVGRDTAALDEREIARAVVESLAENASDAVVAPLLWGAVAGAPGLSAYRAANTLDAMVGHHRPRYERFGWAAARLDDLLNLPAARLTGLLILAARPVGARGATRAWWRDARRHPSPNAGVVEAACAGSLGIRLGGTNTYPGGRVEHRVVMGDGPPARPEDILRAVELMRRVQYLAALGCAAVAFRLPRAGRPT